MPTQAYNLQQINAYRAAAAELRRSVQELEQRFRAAILDGDSRAADNALRGLQVETEAFKAFRKGLDPGVAFLAEHGVEVHNTHTVSFVIAQGVCRLDILQAAQALVADRDLIFPGLLDLWKQDSKMTTPGAQAERICIDGHVEGGGVKTLAEQEKFLARMNLEMSSLGDLAVAFAVHYISTGESLFGWCDVSDWSFVVRASGGALSFSSEGLNLRDIYEGYGHSYVAVAARVGPEAKKVVSPSLASWFWGFLSPI